jgi:hypothetical protein
MNELATEGVESSKEPIRQEAFRLVVGGEGLRQGLDQTRPICLHDGDYESGGHARVPLKYAGQGH